MPLQYLFPVYNASDSLNQWVNQTGASGNAYSYINEGISTPTDDDYVIYTTGASTTPEITLGRLMVVPSSITLSHRMSGVGSITSILLRDTNNITIASTTGVQSLSGNFTTRTVTMSGVNLNTRNYGNAHLLINFSDTPNDIAISAIDMNVSGTLSVITASRPFYIYSARKAYFPPQFGEGGFSSGFSSGFGNDDDLFPLYINSTARSSGNINLFVGQYNTIRMRPSGDSYVNDWISSSGTTTGLWEYVNQPTDSTLPDETYIYNYQSGVVNNPSYLYMIGDSGVYRCDLNGSGIQTIDESSYLYASVTNGCYNPIEDTIYYGSEVGTTKNLSMISVDSFIGTNISNNIGGGLGFDIKDNIIYSLSKNGLFYKSDFNDTETQLSALAGSVREMPNRRLRIDHIRRKIYAVTQDQTSMLSRLHCYDIDSPGWSQLRTLSHGIYGGAFDIDFDNSGIYYAATSGDLTSTAFYGIVKENMYSGTGTRIINPGGSAFFQCNELVLDNTHNKLYYVGQNNSGATLQYDIVKTELDGSSPSTILSMPESSGANVLLVDGGIHKSYIDFTLTDFSADFGNPTNSNKQIADCYVSIEAMNNAASGFAFVTAKILDETKTISIWQPMSRGSGVFLGGQVEASGYKIGLGNGYITSIYNNNVMWNNSVMRLELAAYNPDNSGDFRIYNAEAVLTSAANPVESSSVDLYVYGKDLSTEYLPLTTLAGASIGSVDLYTFTATPIASGIETYIQGYGAENSGISLYTRSAQTKTSSLNMYLSVRTPQYYSGDITFVTEGNTVPKGVKSLPLFVQVDGSDSGVYGKMNLYTLGYGAYDITARMNLYMNCTAPQYSSGVNLFIYNTRDYASGVLSMYMHVKSGVQGSLPASGNMPLFIQRRIESDAHRLNLYIPGPSGETGTTTLYITGANISSSGISMVIPDVLGTNSGITKLYVNGF